MTIGTSLFPRAKEISTGTVVPAEERRFPKRVLEASMSGVPIQKWSQDKKKMFTTKMINVIFFLTNKILTQHSIQDPRSSLGPMK